MTRKAILQIGTEKTGTTSLQSFLAANRAQLAERGFLYPRFCGALNHTGLAAYAMADERPDPIKLPFGGDTPDAIPKMRARLRKLAAAELSGAQNAIFCSEHCHSRLRRQDEVARLRDLLAESFDDVVVSIYLRRQDRLALSLYSTKLKSGATPTRIMPEPGSDPAYYDYDRVLTLWESVFGKDAVHVRLYEKDLLTNGSIVDDFLACWDLGQAQGFRQVPNENSAIDTSAQAFLRAINPALAELDEPVKEMLRGSVVSALERSCPGRGVYPARRDAEVFFASFAASNAAVAVRYFPERTQLFDADFSIYPEKGDMAEVSVEATARVALRLLQNCEDRFEKLEAEIAIRDAQILWRDGAGEPAVATVRAALARTPTHAGLHRTLGEFLLRLEHPGDSVAAAIAACDLDPGNWEYWHFRGIAEAAAGLFPDAVAAQLRARALNPGHGGIEEGLRVARAQSARQQSKRS